MTSPAPDNFLKRAASFLEARGVDDLDLIQRLGLRIVPSGSIFKDLYPGGFGNEDFSRDNRVAITIPHYSLHGEKLRWWYARLVDAGEASGYLSLVRDNRPKTIAPPKYPPHAYLCPLTPWVGLTYCQRVYIHQSAFSAINGALLGYHSVGLQDITKYSTDNKALVAELLQIPWRDLELQPVIVLDSGQGTLARLHTIRLSYALQELCGAKPALSLALPDSDGGWSFDLARKALGDDWAHEFLKGEGETVPGTELDADLAQLNTEVAWVRDLSRVVDLCSGTMLREKDFTGSAFCNRKSMSTTKGGKPRWVRTASKWLEWEDRLEVQRVIYAPGQPQITADYYNSWRGMGLDPQPGDVGPILSFIDNNIAEELRNWFLDWLAYPLQNLGSKMTTCAVLVGPPGTGKSLLASWLCQIYGRENSVSIGRKDFANQYNTHYVRTQFMVVDEMFRTTSISGLKDTNQLKKLITDSTIIVHTKGVPEYPIDSRMNVLITTNYRDAIKLDGDDRRFAILSFRPIACHRDDRAYWEGIVEYMKNGGTAAFYDYLLTRDLSGFNPHGWAPESAEKRAMIDASFPELENFAK